jgi:hypothetical protein
MPTNKTLSMIGIHIKIFSLCRKIGSFSRKYGKNMTIYRYVLILFRDIRKKADSKSALSTAF